MHAIILTMIAGLALPSALHAEPIPQSPASPSLALPSMPDLTAAWRTLGLPPLPRLGFTNSTSRRPPWLETAAGAEISQRSRLLYSSVTLAPSGGLWRNGFRARIAGGYGTYRYASHYQIKSGGTLQPVVSNYFGSTAFAEALLGYQQAFGPLYLKAFAGLAAISHELQKADLTPLPPDCVPVIDTAVDPCNPAQGFAYGPKLALEAWLNIASRGWLAADVSYATPHHTYAAHARAGYRLRPDLSFGLETGISGNAGLLVDLDPGEAAKDSRNTVVRALQGEIRAGAFARYEWSTGDVSVSAGYAFFHEQHDDVRATPYVTLTSAIRF